MRATVGTDVDFDFRRASKSVEITMHLLTSYNEGVNAMREGDNDENDKEMLFNSI